MKVIKQSAHIVKEWPKMNLYERCEFAGRISHASEDKIKEGSAEEFVRRMVKLGHESVFEFARIKWRDNNINKWKTCNLRFVREQAKKIKYFADTIQCEFYPGLILSLADVYFDFFSDFSSDYLLWRGDSGFKKRLAPWEEVDDWIPVVIVTNRAISHQLVRYRKDVVYLQQSQRYVKFNGDIDFISPDVYFGTDNKGKGYNMFRQWIESMEGAERDYIHCLSEGYSAQAARLFLPNSTATKLIMYASPDTWRHVFEQRISDKADPMIRELLEPLKEEFVKEGLL